MTFNMKMVAYVIFVMLTIHVNGDCDTFFADIAECQGMYEIPNTTSSVITYCDFFYPICADKGTYLSCYSTAISTCEDDKRLYNPLIMDAMTAKAVLHGCCGSQEAFDQGKECVGSQFDALHAAISTDCFPVAQTLQVANSAVSSGNWTGFCTFVDDSYNCITALLQPFNCTEEYTSAYSKLMYNIMPPYCKNNSAVFEWINGIERNNCPTLRHFVGIYTITPMLLSMYYIFTVG